MMAKLRLTNTHFGSFDILVCRIQDIRLGEAVEGPDEISIFRKLFCGQNMQPDDARRFFMPGRILRLGG